MFVFIQYSSEYSLFSGKELNKKLIKWKKKIREKLAFIFICNELDSHKAKRKIKVNSKRREWFIYLQKFISERFHLGNCLMAQAERKKIKKERLSKGK